MKAAKDLVDNADVKVEGEKKPATKKSTTKKPAAKKQNNEYRPFNNYHFVVVKKKEIGGEMKIESVTKNALVPYVIEQSDRGKNRCQRSN